jgi:hypothetical protein
MAANSQQGRTLTLFWTALTFVCAGIAYITGGFGKLVLLLGLAGTALALISFLRLKPMEGKPGGFRANRPLVLAGLAVTWGGWFVTMVGLQLTGSPTGRLVFALVGIAVSLSGILGVLPVAFGKARTAAARPEPATLKPTMEHGR